MRKEKNKLKKLFLLFLLVSLLVVGCGKQEEKPVVQETQTEEESADIPDDLLPSGKQEEKSEKKQKDRVSKEESQVQETQPEKEESEADKPKTDKTQTDKPKTDKPKTDKPKTDVSSKDKPKTETPVKENTIQVKISIECKAAVKEGYTGPATLLATKTLTLKKGATVYDALEASGVAFSGAAGYVAGINGVYEFDWGSESGWVYYVNGSKPNVSSAKYVCKDGDVIQWKYTTKL